MSVRQYATRDVITLRAERKLDEAAAVMREKGLGCVVVVDAQNRATGVVTDRDVALSTLHRGKDPKVATLGELLPPELFSVREDDPLPDAIHALAEHGVRRLPVQDADGRLVGLLSSDDVLPLLAKELEGLRRAVTAQRPEVKYAERTRTARDHYQKLVVTVAEDATVKHIADRMAEAFVGTVVVLAEDSRPVGIVTDRDLALRALYADTQSMLTARDVMSQPLVAAAADARLEQVVDMMSEYSIRRVPIVDEGRVVGIVSLDDVLSRVSHELGELGAAARHAIERARRGDRLRKLRRDLHETLDWSLTRAEELGEKAQDKLGRELHDIRERLRDRMK